MPKLTKKQIIKAFQKNPKKWAKRFIDLTLTCEVLENSNKRLMAAQYQPGPLTQREKEEYEESCQQHYRD